MNNKIATIICCLLLVFLFSACKKEKSTTPDPHSIDLFVLNPYRLDSTGPTSYTYKLRGSIVSPVKLEINDYGFFVKDNGGPVQLKMGSGYKAGYVEYDYKSASQLMVSDITMYAILKRGDTLYSSISTNPSTNFSSGINPALQLTSFQLTPLPANDIFLTTGFSYNTGSGYTVGTYELLYKQSTAPNFNSLSLLPYASNNQVSGLSLLQKLGISAGVSYDFEIHIVLNPPSGSSFGPFDLPSNIQTSSY